MAKKFNKFNTSKKAKKDNLYPSEYGSHESMIDSELTNKILKTKTTHDNCEMVICRDENGPYITQSFKTKNNYRLADPNRHMELDSRLKRLKLSLRKGTDLEKKDVG